MPLNRVKVFQSGTIPTAADLEAEFDNIVSKFNANIVASDLAEDILSADLTAINAALYDTLAEAVTDAVLTGKEVVIPPGTYDSDSTTINVPDNVVIRGAGSGLVTIRPATNFTQGRLFRITGRNVRISGIRFEAVNLASTNFFFNMLDVNLLSNSDDITGVEINDCKFYSNPGVLGCTAQMINIVHQGADDTLVKIRNNHFSENVVTGITTFGIGASDVPRMLISRNIFSNLTGQAINIIETDVTTIEQCSFHRTTAVAGTTLSMLGSGVIKQCNFLSNADDSTATPMLNLDCSGYRGVLAVHNNVVQYTNQLSFPANALLFRGKVVIRDNEFRIADTGFTDGAIKQTDPPSGQAVSEVYVQRNTINNGTLYAIGSLLNNDYGKLYDDANLLRLGDVWVWLTYTGGSNYLRFKRGDAPTTATDDDARIELTGANDLTL